MYLTRHQVGQGARWALDDYFLPTQINLNLLLELPKAKLLELLKTLPTSEAANGAILAPLEAQHEVWASGVTYSRSREARKAESEVGDVYDRVYEAARPELFLKAVGWRVRAHHTALRIRQDSNWNVPEPELVLVVNRFQEIVGYCAGNDMSSRSIEGENPLYLPQAKIYNGSCALGPGIVVGDTAEMRDLPIELTIMRGAEIMFQGETRTARIKRPLEELVAYLVQELEFPNGCFLFTGTGIVPPDSFSLQIEDRVQIRVGALTLLNSIQP